MRFPLAYYLMLIYLSVMFRPLVPVISDTYAHIFGEAIHVATVHAKYGSHHLEKDVAKSSEDNGGQKNLSLDDTCQVHINQPVCLYDFSLNDIIFRRYFMRLYNLSEIHLSGIIRPPKC